MAYHQNEGQCEKLKEWLNVCGTHLGPGQRSAFSGRSAGMRKGCAGMRRGLQCWTLRSQQELFLVHCLCQVIVLHEKQWHSTPQHLLLGYLQVAAAGSSWDSLSLSPLHQFDLAAPAKPTSSSLPTSSHKSLPSPSFTVTWHAMAYLDVSTQTWVDHNEI